MNDTPTGETVSAIQDIANLDALKVYLAKIRSITVEGRFDNTHCKRLLYVSCLRSGRGIILAPTPERLAAVAVDPTDLIDCFRVFWPLNENRVAFLSSGFRGRSLEFTYIEQPHSSVVKADPAQRGVPIVRVTPPQAISGIAELAGFLRANPWVVIGGDYLRIHYRVRVARLQISPLDLLLDYGGGEIIRLPCPPVQAFRFRPSGFAIFRLSFTYTLAPA
jgi:hypothetical protein